MGAVEDAGRRFCARGWFPFFGGVGRSDRLTDRVSGETLSLMRVRPSVFVPEPLVTVRGGKEDASSTRRPSACSVSRSLALVTRTTCDG